MTVARILQTKGREVATISPSASLADASHMLADRRIGAVVVVGSGHSVAGILSERDIVRAVSVHGAVALDKTVEDTMTRKVVSCVEADTIREIMERMTAGRFRHMPVVERGKLVGLISIGDVVKARLAEMETESRMLKDYVMGA